MNFIQNSMQDNKEYIREVLKDIHKASYRIKPISTNLPKNVKMDRRAFRKIIIALREIDERRDFMEQEIGLDMTSYEDKFFNIIEDLLKVVFNKSQLALIQMYLYQLFPDKEWDGTITITKDNKDKIVPFKKLEDVWDVITMVSK